MPLTDSKGATTDVTLPNGLRVVHEQMPWLPTLSAALLFQVGSTTDPAGREGSAAVLHDWLQRGAKGMNSRELSNAFEELGVRLGGSAGRESATLTASFLAADAKRVLPLMASMVTDPLLETSEFAPARELALEELRGLEDAPTSRLFEELSARYLRSPHGRSPYGTLSGLNALTPGNVREDAARRLGPKGAVLAIAGGASWGGLKGSVEDAFGEWSGDTAPLPEPGENPPARHHVNAETQQVQLGLAYRSALPGTEEGYRYMLALNVLSGSMGARLFTEVREKRGLVYSVHAAARALRGFGYTIGYAGTTTERANETLEVFLAELARLSEGVSETELERARTGTLSSVILRGESSGSTAMRLASDTFLLGEPRTLSEIRERVERVTLDEINDYLANNPVPTPTVVTLGQLPGDAQQAEGEA